MANSGEAVSPLTARLASKYKVVSKLGEGTYGVVYKVVNRQTHEKCAVKIMDLGDTDQSAGINKSTLVEISLLKRLHHPNIVKIVEIDIDVSSQKINLVMELAKCALDDTIKTQWFKPGMRSRRCEQLRDQLRIAFQITCALNYLHINRIIHLDLKPANILIRSNGTVAIADFGISERAESVKSEGHHVVTWPYRAPEIVCGAQSYQEASDIWSLGVLLLLNFFDFKLVSRAGDKESQLYAHFVDRIGPMSSTWHTEYRRNQLSCPLRSPALDIRSDDSTTQPGMKSSPPRPKYHKDIHPFYISFYGKNTYEHILSFIDQCLQYDPRERATAQQLLSHALFKECIAEERESKEGTSDSGRAHTNATDASVTLAVAVTATSHKLLPRDEKREYAVYDSIKNAKFTPDASCYVCEVPQNVKHAQILHNIQIPVLLNAKCASSISASTATTCVEIFNRYMRMSSENVSSRHQTKPYNDTAAIEAACLILAGKLMNDKTNILRLHRLANITNLSKSILQDKELHIVHTLDWNLDGAFNHEDWE